MKKLMVAGCSFSAPSKTAPGTSWSEKIANQLGWELVNLARQGCSNGGIRIQIEEIRRQRPDFAIITPTFWDRMEIPSTAAPFDWNSGPNVGENPPLERHLQKRDREGTYNRQDGIRNVNYGNQPSNLICETIFTLAENFPHPYRSGLLNKNAQTAIRHYIDCMYDTNWKKQQDEWIIAEGIMQLYLDGINFIVAPELLWPFDPDNQEQWRNAFPKKLIPDQYIVLNERESKLSIAGHNGFQGEDPGYHSNERGQEIMAENYLRRMRNDFNLP